jgi:hypothetical protein
MNHAAQVIDTLAGVVSQDVFYVRREPEPEPPVMKVYRTWITPEGLPPFPLAVDAFSLAEALELARKAAPFLPQVGRRPFTVSGRAA